MFLCLSGKTGESFSVYTVKIVCLFVVLRRFQHCTGHITTGSWKGRGNQHIQFARVLYCKLPTNGKQLPAFPLKAMTGVCVCLYSKEKKNLQDITKIKFWHTCTSLESYYLSESR